MTNVFILGTDYTWTLEPAPLLGFSLLVAGIVIILVGIFLPSNKTRGEADNDGWVRSFFVKNSRKKKNTTTR